MGPARTFWAVFAVAQALYLLIMVWSLPRIAAEAGGLVAFDARPLGYDYEAAHAFLMALSLEGRSHYLGVQLPLDLAYPAILATMFALGFRQLFRGGHRRALMALALCVVAFDYLENFWIGSILGAGVEKLGAETVAWASLWTVMKSACTTLAYAALIYGAGRAAWRKRARRAG